MNEPTTQKVVIHKAGGLDRLTIETHPSPHPGSDHVLIDVEAIGVNYADCCVRMGLYESAKKYVGWPITPGFEVAGRVAALGEGVEDGFSVGDPVFAITRFGGYATRLTVPAHQVFAQPSSFTVEQSAALPAVALTAWFALFELAHPRPGQDVLVHSAAGGVGGALVQLLKIAGCRVVAVVGSSHKVDYARKLGADEVIDKSRESLWRAARRHAPQGYQLILDANGVETLGQSYAHLRPPGKLVVYGFHTMLPRHGGVPNWPRLIFDYLRTPRFNPLRMTSENRSVLAFNLSFLFEEKSVLARAMSDVSRWLEDGRLQPPQVTTYAFERVADAHRDLESAQTLGKLVLLT